MELHTFWLLFTYTAGTLLYLFLAVLLAGLRRPRLLESLFFLTLVTLFLFYSGNLLLLNASIHYEALPSATENFAELLVNVGLALFPALLIHAHIEFWKRLAGSLRLSLHLALLFLAYGPLAALPLGAAVFEHSPYWLRTPESLVVFYFLIWLALALFVAASVHRIASRRVQDAVQARLHRGIHVVLTVLGFVVLLSSLYDVSGPATSAFWYALGLACRSVWESLLILPGAVVGYFVIRYRFLALGAQRNLVLTVTVAFLGLMYLTLARRLSVWFEPWLPPEATVSILLFTLVIFFEPLQRRMGKMLQRAFRAEAEQLQRLTAEIQHDARAGNLSELINFAETRIRDSFSLSDVRISLHDGPTRPATLSGNVQRFVLRNGPAEIGVLEAYFFGQSLSGETHAALDYLSEQLPAAMDLCRLLDEKLRLERELAERERLALLGQMAASVSHNLRNPLSSMKTLLQLQLENPGLPASARSDCEKVIAEVDRLNDKLTQLLRYAKPAVRAASGITAVVVDAAAIAAQTVSLLQHEAERRGVSLALEGASEKAEAASTEEALSDVLSNLIVNAIEALPPGGTVRVRLTRRDSNVVLEILDDGLGIPEYVRPRIFQPFFTTKPSGTGLGLAIVEKRIAEIGATIECESPVLNARGTRFVVTLRAG